MEVVGTVVVTSGGVEVVAGVEVEGVALWQEGMEALAGAGGRATHTPNLGDLSERLPSSRRTMKG